MSEPAMAGAIDRAHRESPFLKALLDRNSPPGEQSATRGLTADVCDLATEPVARALRIERQRVALAVALGDLSGALTFEAVVETLSDFADRALDRAIRAAIAERTPDAEPAGFAAIALGKHGSRELNYSSDIDPILIFDPETLPLRPREEPAEAAVRIARRVVELLQARDADGYVLRVDLRLRPSPEVTPIALPVGAAISYYESSAMPWERAAFIRARACAGDVALGQDFLDSIRPFVWRRALDYGALREIRGISRRIRDHHAQGQAFGPGYDLKRGRGGIREVEFFAQIHQLIHGGRDPALRAPATLDALAALSGAGHIDPADAVALAGAYRLFRTVEHRLQMVDDRQTHTLPADREALDGVARLHGLADGEALLGLLRPHVEAVGALYDALDDADAAPGLSPDPALLEAHLAAAGFADAATARARIELWRDGGHRALRSDAARAALEEVLPALVEAIGASPDPIAALNRLDDVIARLPSAINLFRLLAARPALLKLLGDVLAHAPTLAEQLRRRAELLDGMLDTSALDPAPPVAELEAGFSRAESGADYQQRLDLVRRLVNERRFALGVQLVEGASDPLAVAAGYARVAEAALGVLARDTVAEFERAHGRVPGSELAILGLGRLGGAALTHASDLDLIYVFTGDHLAESDGPKPLGAVHYYNRLAQRVTAALSVPTAAGPLYEVDTRLRPSGAQGPLTVSLAAFERYQRESAWTWEHMALTRARPVFGSADARAALEASIAETLAKPRDRKKLLADARSMRADMLRRKPPAGPFDVKLAEGGLIDLEFCVHVAQLEHRTGFTPMLDQAIAALAGQGLLPPALADAHALMMRMLVTLRLVAPDGRAPASATRALVARACRCDGWAALERDYAAARASVKAAWTQIMEDNDA